MDAASPHQHARGRSVTQYMIVEDRHGGVGRANGWVKAGVICAVLSLLLTASAYFGVKAWPDKWLLVDVDPPPSPAVQATWPATPDCTPMRHWSHHFEDDYRGEVYLLVTASTRTSLRATITLRWGAKWWTRSDQPVYAGLITQQQGGTLFRFDKNSSSDSNPTVTLDSNVPVCAVFGTAEDRPAPQAVIDTPEWSRK